MSTLAIFLCLFAWPKTESNYASEIAARTGWKEEVVLWDRTRVDLLSATHAWEVDWARKHYQAVGQALHYGIMTGKKPGIILLCRRKGDEWYIWRCKTTCVKYGIQLKLEWIE